MRDKKEYIVGEIFRFNEQTFQCVASDIPYIRCKKCVMPHNRCCDAICDKTRRYDLRDVHFIRVTNPENGMLFRTSDGVLYELIENECIHYMGDSLCTCYEIDQQAFGDIISNKFHWYPVEDKKEMEEKMIDYSEIDLRKVYMKRHLELAVVDVKNVDITFKVVDQFYGGDEFSKQANKHEFTAKNGITIRLDEKFEWDGFNRILSLRRIWNTDNVDETANCYVHQIVYILQAISEYNETDGIGYKKSWPQDGDEYYFMTPNGTIEVAVYHSESSFPSECKAFGNLFRTREEAEAAREHVKTILNKK